MIERLIDPPGWLDSIDEWKLFLAEMRELPQDEPDVIAAIAEAERIIAEKRAAD